jgi:tight adherence protein C
MTGLLVVAALAFAGGIWMLVSAIAPARVPIADAVARLHAPPPTTTIGDGIPGATGHLGRLLLRAMGGRLRTPRLTADLAVTRRPAEQYAGTLAAGGLAGAISGPLLAFAGTAAGVGVGWLSLWFVPVGAASGVGLVEWRFRQQVVKARTDFRHALGAYLDVLVLLFAANEGPEGAMSHAAKVGTGPAFEDLRRATVEARLGGEPVWDTLDRLGRTLNINELREIAAAGQMAGDQGASVRKTLITKARSLRQASLAEQESAGNARARTMFAPIIVLGLGFLLFIVYPATNLIRLTP